MNHSTISLSEATAPLREGEGRFRLEAGVVLRGQIRRGAATYGVDFFEQKGILDSLFMFRGPTSRIQPFMERVKQLIAEIDKE